MFSSLKSIRIQLLILVFICVLPVLGILIYSGLDREQHEIEEANTNAINMVQSLSFEYEHTVASTHQLLMTLSKLPDVQNQNAPACNRLFGELLKGNPLYANIFAATAEGMVFSSALPFTPFSISNRKYFKDVLQTKGFSVGEYLMGVFSYRPVLPFAHPVTDSNGRIKAVVVAGIDLSRYGQMFPTSKLPEGSVLSLSDHKGVSLYLYPDPEKCVGKADNPAMIRHMSAQPGEGSFIEIGADGVKRLYAYKRFRLSINEPVYLYMRVGIPEEEVLRDARKLMYVNMSLLGFAFIIAMLSAWFIGKIVIVKRLDKLVTASHKLGQGDLTVRTGLPYREDEMGLLARTFDEMAEKLENKESNRRLAEEALRRSEEKYRNLADSLPQIVFEADMQGNITFVNRAAFTISGYTVEDCDKGFNVLQVFIPKDHERARLNMQKILAGEESKRNEYTFLRKDGSTFPVITHGVPIIRNNQTVGLRGVVIEITDIRGAEEALVKERGRLMTLLNLYRMPETPIQDITSFIVEECIRISESELGFFGFINEDETLMMAHMWSKKAMADCAMDPIPVEFPLERAGIWAEAIRQHKPVIVNDYQKPDSRKKGYPEGHVPIARLMSIPIVKDQHAVAITAVANKKQDYTESDLLHLSLFLESVWGILQRKKAEEDRHQSLNQLRKALGATIQAMAAAVEIRDPYTAGHQKKVADLARAIATEMGLSGNQIDGVRMASVIHDIGKISVPAEILSKPTKLTEIEFSLIKTHSQSGYDILKDMEFPWPIARIVLEHHERMDGSGYPNGLTGETLLIESRILAVADVVEAIASHRPYRPGQGIDAALEEISKNRGTLYDPDVADACLRLFKEKGYELEDR